ncbi:hypothetical protein ANAPC5_01267 [Anaplasma phagocytophilum]|nr:hypothetical protein ANAPC4_00439 [Anaplasma phagocytophilum]SBO31447.1 hypothetical protein ANAPC2_00660 [Anaplasma phagocytophilum]SBO31518.1 hypothetical protein ANAPC3_00558 [Anaplasma phagocytophilum]SCV65880.1 hypothetical protein ANAPC5_01267 [Anaplasma phagocytophilum]
MLGKSIKPLYGPAKYGELLIVVCFVSDAALILPSYFLSRGIQGLRRTVCAALINHAHEVTPKPNASIRNDS